MNHDMIDRYNSTEKIIAIDGCHYWLGLLSIYGYGMIFTKGKSVFAHRVSYFINKGNPNGLFVRHICNNRSCVNPDHLFLGIPGNNKKRLADTSRYRKTKKGVVTNLFQKLSARNTVEFDLNYLHEFSKCKKFDRLFIEWEKSNYSKQLKPTLDRISNKKGYLKDNIQWLSWSDNRYKQKMERRSRKGPVLQMCGDKVVNRFKSQRDAAVKTGLLQSSISAVMTGKLKTTGGYSFVYDTNNNLK